MKTKKKQFGTYDGGMLRNSAFLATCTEQELYFYIKAFKKMISQLSHDMERGKMPKDLDLTPCQYALEFCMMHTSRFGVKIEQPTNGEHVKATDSYLAWFHWWNEYFQKTLTNKEYKKYQHKLEKGEDISHFRPSGNWRDNI